MWGSTATSNINCNISIHKSTINTKQVVNCIDKYQLMIKRVKGINFANRVNTNKPRSMCQSVTESCRAVVLTVCAIAIMLAYGSLKWGWIWFLIQLKHWKNILLQALVLTTTPWKQSFFEVDINTQKACNRYSIGCKFVYNYFVLLFW